MSDITIASLGSLLGIAIVASLVMTVLIKPILWPTNGPGQDRFAGLITVLVAIVLAFAGDLILPDPADIPPDQVGRVVYDAVLGFLAGLVAIGGYTAGKRLTEA